MTNHGDDCFFYYYSTCTKGDSCSFRHCEAAMGTEVVCNLWQKGNCFRRQCKFRHMEVTKNRKEIPCYWENQPSGCQKPHCAFFHEKPRFVQGQLIPPDKNQSRKEEEQQKPHEEEDTAAGAAAAAPAPAPAPAFPPTTNPQLRGVIKADTQEPVPSPTHPPVVINAADDDEDEDEDGEEGRCGPSPRKQPRSADPLGFWVSTLEEIRLRKALMASMRTAYTQVDGAANGEKENMATQRGPAGPESLMSSGVPVTARLGARTPHSGVAARELVPMRRSLAERLGAVVEENPAPTAGKPVKERLGSSSGSGPAAARPAESGAESQTPARVRIKSLEEIRHEKEKATRTGSSAHKSGRGARRVTLKDPPGAKRRRHEDRRARDSDPKKEQQKEPSAAQPGKVRVKTLEEIRREKAARLQAEQSGQNQSSDPENQRNSDPENQRNSEPEGLSGKRRLLRVQKAQRQTQEESAEEPPEQKQEPKQDQKQEQEQKQEQTGSVQVKTFEEIMREKRLRRQEEQLQAQSGADPAAGPDSDPAALPPAPKVRKLVSLRARAVAAEPQSSPPSTSNHRTSSSSASRQPDQNRSEPTDSAGESKVRPKLNVKPSVVKPSAPLRPAQKKRGVERSAVAAVKPLNSAPSVPEQPMQQPSNPPTQMPPPPQHGVGAESRLSANQSGVQVSGPMEASVPPHRSAAPSPRPRRVSAARAASCSEPVDEFEELISQFTGDHLEEDVDPALGEDDLLQELSQMIDS